MEPQVPLLVSAGSTDITPRHPVPLAGYARRTGGYEGISDKLEANAVVLRSNGKCYVILSLDLLYASRLIRDTLMKRFDGGIRGEDLLIAASHTHFAPATDPTKPLLGLLDEKYLRFLLDQLEALLCGLLHQPGIPAYLLCNESIADHSVNRRLFRRMVVRHRRLQCNMMLFAPNPSGPRDETIRALSICRASGEIVCILWNYCCHPTAFPKRNHVSADFPGAVRAALRKVHGANIPVLFLQGFAGNIRPRETRHSHNFMAKIRALVAGPQFSAFTEEAWMQWTCTLSDLVVKATSVRGAWPWTHSGGLSSKRVEIPLDRFVVNAPVTRTVSFHSIAFGEHLCLLAISAEPVVEYVPLLRGLSPRKVIIPVGYTDDVFGYLPTENMIRQGGYEAKDFLEPFSLSGPLSPDLETESWNALISVLQQQVSEQ